MKGRLRSVTATFLAGILTGGCLVALFTAHHVETLKVDLATARMDLGERRAEVERLQAEVEAAQKRSMPVVRSLTVAVGGVDGPQAVSVKKAVLSILATVPGLPLSRVDPVLFQDLLDRRVVVADGALYQLELKAAVIAPDLHLTVDATPIKGP